MYFNGSGIPTKGKKVIKVNKNKIVIDSKRGATVSFDDDKIKISFLDGIEKEIPFFAFKKLLVKDDVISLDGKLYNAHDYVSPEGRIVLKGVTVRGDFENVEKIRSVGSLITISLKNGKSFLINRTNPGDEIDFNTIEGEATLLSFPDSEGFRNTITTFSAFTKKEHAKALLAKNIQFPVAIASAAVCTTLNHFFQNNTAYVCELISFGILGTAIGVKLGETLIHKTNSNRIKKDCGEFLPKETVEIEGFETKQKGVAVVLEKEEMSK